MNISWSIDAIEDFEQNLHYLENEFSESEVSKFINKTQQVLTSISRHPKLFKNTNYKNVHAAPIVSAITLYYRIKSKNEIELIRFWNNYKNPESLKMNK